jgi:hypothetical protein
MKKVVVFVQKVNKKINPLWEGCFLTKNVTGDVFPPNYPRNWISDMDENTISKLNLDVFLDKFCEKRVETTKNIQDR